MTAVAIQKWHIVFLVILWLIALSALSATLVLIVNGYGEHIVTLVMIGVAIGSHITVVGLLQYLLCKGEIVEASLYL
jgi:hypothetical protein